MRVAVERKECGICARNSGSHVDRVIIHREVHQTAAPEWLPRIAPSVLCNTLLNTLPREVVLHFNRSNRQTIEQNNNIHRLVGCLGREMHLPGHSEAVGFITSLMFRVAAARWSKICELQVDTVEGDAVAQYLQRAAPLDQRGNLHR